METLCSFLTSLGPKNCVTLLTNQGASLPCGSVCETYPKKAPVPEGLITNPVI